MCWGYFEHTWSSHRNSSRVWTSICFLIQSPRELLGCEFTSPSLTLPRVGLVQRADCSCFWDSVLINCIPKQVGNPRIEASRWSWVAPVKELLERLLVLLSRWRSRDPESLDESEIVENLFNVLCLLLVWMAGVFKASKWKESLTFCVRRKFSISF